MYPTPPRLADYLLRIFCASHRLEEVQGDLREEFAWQVRRIGLRRARWRYWWDVLAYFNPRTGGPFTIQPTPITSSFSLFNPIMLRNYFAIAFRQLWKNQLFSALNIIGLTVGLAVSTFIALYVWHEFHYDQFEPFANRTYRVLSAAKYGGEEFTSYGLHESFGRSIKQQIPEVEQVVRWSDGLGSVVLQTNPTHRFKEENIGYADPSMLSVMGYRLRQGDPKTALTEPGRIVLTHPLAEKYFGNQNPIGKTILFDKHYPLTVSGVLDDLPTHSTVGFNALVSLSSMTALGAQQQDIYKRAGFLTTFLVLREGANVQAVEQKLEKVKSGIKFVDLTAKYILESLPTLHLDSRSGGKGSRQSLYILLTIALIILLLAIINYVSLTTARATKRAREVGVRKAIGGQRQELISQFFLESFLTTSLAFVLSLVLLQAFFPWASHTLDLTMDRRVLSQGPYWGLMVSLWFSCSLLAGAYPALLLSNFRPATVLKGTTMLRYSGVGLRQILTTIQLTTSIGLLICSLILFAQMRLLKTKSLGINRAQVVALYIDSEMTPQFPALRSAVKQWAGDNNVAVTDTKLFTNNIMTYFLKTQKTKKQLMVNVLSVDKPFFDMMGVQWKNKPVDWSEKPITNELTIYNQTVIKEAGIQGNPLQQPAPFADQSTQGVVSDFHVRSLRDPVSPMTLTVVSDTNRSIVANGGYLLVRLQPGTNVSESLASLKTLYDQSQPSAPFDYYFLDDAYNLLYKKEERLTRLFTGFTGLTLLVACLGLLGLMTFSIEARTKEIGIRKVLGASVSSIVAILSRDFIRLILIALVIASPIAWWAMTKWLEDFANKITIEWWVFAGAGGLVISLVLLTTSVQSLRAALTNPVKSLRSE